MPTDSTHVHFTASGAGTPIVFTSGIGDTSEAWTDLFHSLKGNSRVLSWDFRGHGRSKTYSDAADYSQEFAFNDLLSMIAAAGGSDCNPAVLVGHSLGGYLSLKVAQSAPELVRALVLISSGPGFRDRVAREKWNEYLLSMDLGSQTDPLARLAALQTNANVLINLPYIRIPVLVIVGSEDRNFVAAKDYLLSKLPNATAVVVADANHSVHRTHPTVVKRTILDFLAASGTLA